VQIPAPDFGRFKGRERAADLKRGRRRSRFENKTKTDLDYIYLIYFELL
jgi:hypothetical protein